MTAYSPLRVFAGLAFALVGAVGCAKKPQPAEDAPATVQIEPGQPAPNGGPAPTGSAVIEIGPRAAVREPKPDAAAGQGLVAAPRAHMGPRGRSVNSLAFTADGRWLVTGGGADIQVWDLRTGQVAQRIAVHDPKRITWTHVFGFAPDGKTLAATGTEDELCLYDLTTGTRRSFKHKDGGTKCAAFTADGKAVYTRPNYKRKVVRWDVASGAIAAESDEVVDSGLDRGLAVTPDGKTVAVGGKDGDLVLLDGQTLKEKKRLTGHKRRIHDAALSPDGKTLATVAFDDQMIKFWDVEAGTEIRTLKLGYGLLTDVAFSPSGKYLVSGGGSVVVWDVATGAQLADLEGKHGNIEGLAFSPDGAMVAAGANAQLGVKVWDLSHTLEKSKVERPKGRGPAAISPGGTKYAVRRDDAVEVRVLTTDTIVRLLPGKTEGPISFNPDGTLLSRFTDRKVVIADVATGTAKASIELNDDLRLLKFTADGKRVVIGVEKRLEVWDVAGAEPKRLVTSDPLPEAVDALALAPDGKALAVSAGFAIHAVDAGTGRVLWSSLAHEKRIGVVRYSADGSRVLTAAGGDPAVRVWDTTSGKEVAVLRHTDAFENPYGRGDGRAVWYAFFGPDPGTVVSQTTDGALHLWDAVTGARIAARKARRDDQVILFDPAGKMFVTTTEKEFRVWDVASFGRAAFASGGDVVRDPVTPPKEYAYVPVRDTWQRAGRGSKFAAYSADGKRLVLVDGDLKAYVWDAATGAELNRFTIHTGETLGVALSYDGKQLALAQRDKTVRLWDVDTGTEAQKLVGHTSFVRSCGFSPDGKWLATGNGGGGEAELILWHAPTGTKVKELAKGGGYIDAISFSPDSKWLVAGTSNDGRVFDVASRSEKFKLDHPDTVSRVAVSRDGKLIALGGGITSSLSLNDVTVWDAATGKLVHTLSGHPKTIDELTFTADGVLLVDSGDGYLWDVNAEKMLRRVRGVSRVALSPDGATLASFGFSGIVQMIDTAAFRDERENAALAPLLALGAGAAREPTGTHVALSINGPDSLTALTALKTFPGPLGLTIGNEGTIPDAAIRTIGELKTLRKLVLKAGGLTEQQLKVVVGLSNLEELELSSCRELSPAALATLTKLEKLQSLSLASTKTNADTLRALAALKGLRKLNLEYTSPGDDGIAALTKFPALAELTLNVHGVKEGLAKLSEIKSLRRLNARSDSEVLPYLGKLTQLEELDLEFTGIDDAGLAQLKELTHLRRLNLSYTKVTDAGLVHLKGLTKLTTLKLESLEKLTGTGLAHLKGATGLTALALDRTGITDAGLVGLKDWVHLKSLSLPDEITDAGLLHLVNLTQLESINLDALGKVKGPGLAGLKNSRIRELDLSGRPDATALDALKEWKNLHVLSLPKSVTDADLAKLSGLIELRALRMEDAAGVTDAGLAHLKGLTKLAELDLRGTKVTDAGLPHLLPLTALRQVRFWKTGVTDKAIEEFQGKMPGAYLNRF